MTRRERLVPVVVLAIFAVAVCAASLAHAQPGRPETCMAAKTGPESPPAMPADLAALLVGSVDLPEPRPVACAGMLEAPAGSAPEPPIRPHVPRAPPA